MTTNAILDGPLFGEGHILNDDTAQPGIRVSTPSISLAEGNSGSTAFQFTVTRTGDTSGTSSANWTVLDGADPRVSGSDFVGGAFPSGTVTFNPSETTRVVTIYVAGDTLVESDENFVFLLTGVTTNAILDGPLHGEGHILNDDGPGDDDDYADSASDVTAPIGVLEVDGSISGLIGAADADDTYGDKDVFRVSLTQGQTYEFQMQGSAAGGQALPLSIFTIRNGSNFDQVLATSAIGSSVVQNFTADSTGYFYVRVGTGGQATDQGGYTLSVADITPAPSVSDDYADSPDDTTSDYGIGALAMGGAKTGSIEVAGDKDAFSISVVAGHSYQISLTGEVIGGDALESTYLTVRDGADFSEVIAENGAGSQASLNFVAELTGQVYLRVGAGSSGSATGGYRIVAEDLGVPNSTIPSPDAPADLWHELWLNDVITGALNGTLTLVTESFETAAQHTKTISKSDAFHLNTIFAKVFTVAGIIVDAERINAQIEESDDPVRTWFVEWSAEILGLVILNRVGVLARGAGTLANLFLAPLGVTSSSLIFTQYLSDGVKDVAGRIYDYFNSEENQLINEVSLESYLESQAFDVDPSRVLYFDSEFYIGEHPEVSQQIRDGIFNSAYAHFLTVGINEHFRPNSSQYITSEDIPFSIVNNDTAATSNFALFAESFGSYAGDGASSNERAIAAEIGGRYRVGGELQLDSTLSAIASRKAADLVVNFASMAAVSASGQTNSDWAMNWSNGNALSQQFNAAFSEVFGDDDPSSQFQMFVIASPETDPGVILARFLDQDGAGAAFANADYDTIGIGEYGGVWVIIIGAHADGYTIEAPGADTLEALTQYGGNDNDILYAGTRQGELYGLGGDDRLVGGGTADTLHGGAGDDRLLGGNGDDRLLGDDGDDLIWGEQGHDNARGGAGNDRISGGIGRDQLYGDDGNDRLFGDDGADRVFGGAGQDELDGGAADDLVSGGDGHDFVHGGLGDDRVLGGAGRDRLYGDDGDDVMLGGEGADRVFGGAGDDELDGEAGDDLLSGGGGHDRVHGGLGNDRILGGAGRDQLYGDDGYDVILGGDGADRIFGQAGNDELYGDAGNDLVSGGDGHDFVHGGLGDDRVLGGAGRDRLYGDDGDDVMLGGEGADRVFGGAGDDELDGEAGDDLLSGGGGHDRVHGGLGNDRILGGAGRDQLYGDDGYDVILGGDGADRIFGQAGNDELYGDAGNDLVSGGDGHDTIHGGLGDDRVLGGAGRDRLYGDDGDDTLLGGDGADRIWGGAGRDSLTGGGGNDTLIGGAGNDLIEGGLGDDVASGDDGNDQFIGGAGDDRFEGGAGNFDLAVYSGNFGDYRLVYYEATNQVRVTDLRGDSPDGVDRLFDVELLQFADGTVSVNSGAFDFQASAQPLILPGPKEEAAISSMVAGPASHPEAADGATTITDGHPTVMDQLDDSRDGLPALMVWSPDNLVSGIGWVGDGWAVLGTGDDPVAPGSLADLPASVASDGGNHLLALLPDLVLNSDVWRVLDAAGNEQEAGVSPPTQASEDGPGDWVMPDTPIDIEPIDSEPPYETVDASGWM